MTDAAVVHLVDDESTLLRSLGPAICAAGYACRTYATAPSLLACLSDLEPGCVVTDVRMPGMDGLELMGRLRRAGASHPVIVMSGQADIALAVEAMKQGASDFVEKPFSPKDLIRRIGAALEGAAPVAARRARREEARRKLAQLTPRQGDVLAGVVAGKLNKTIAFELGLSVRTVEDYRAEIMARTGCASLSELLRLSLQAED